MTTAGLSRAKKLSTGKQFGFERWQILVLCFQQAHTCQAAFRPMFPHFPQYLLKHAKYMSGSNLPHWSRFLLFVCNGGLRQMSRTKAKDSCQSFPDPAGRAARSSRATGQTLGQMALRQVDGKRKLLDAICFLILGFSSFLFFCFCFLILFFLDSGKLLKGKWETENRKS